MRSTPISEGEHYHVFNRGMHKQTIFHDDRDRSRFLFLILHCQSPVTFDNIAKDIARFRKVMANKSTEHRVSFTYTSKVEKIVSNKTVELVSVILMPNHFHLILKEIQEGGISAFMQRVLNAYTKYHNARYGVSGHLFQGPYRIVHINDNDQLLYTSAYIHRNCRELKTWRNREKNYPWSSYQDFSKNRWGKLLCPEIILGQFKSPKEYCKFVEESGAKETEMEEISKIES